jgi:hypothetical protein
VTAAWLLKRLQDAATERDKKAEGVTHTEEQRHAQQYGEDTVTHSVTHNSHAERQKAYRQRKGEALKAANRERMRARRAAHQ